MSTVEIKYLCTPHDGTPGEPWEKSEDELLNVAAGKSTKDRPAGPGPAIPGGAARVQLGQKRLATQRKRLKDSYSLLVVHELDNDYKLHVKQNFFQDGSAAFAYMQGELRQPVDRLQLRKLDDDWNALDLVSMVGVSPNKSMVVRRFHPIPGRTLRVVGLGPGSSRKSILSWMNPPD